jgi:hypothetical protein
MALSTCEFICNWIKKGREPRANNVITTVYFQQNKKKAKAEGKNCHATTIIQEFSLRKHTQVTSSASVTRFSSHSLRAK